MRDESYELAEAGKQGNLICNFTTYHVGEHEGTVYELRECPKDDSIYVVWWDKEVLGVGRNNFVSYTKRDTEENFADKIWTVVGNKCKRAIFK